MRGMCWNFLPLKNVSKTEPSRVSPRIAERFFNKIKNFRRIATRYDKTALSFAAVLAFRRRHDLAALNVNTA